MITQIKKDVVYAHDVVIGKIKKNEIGNYNFYAKDNARLNISDCHTLQTFLDIRREKYITFKQQ